ncbi:MAG: hypothetical protein PW734_06145 [Verrucomicrobium sp.]|nr:hypothetical protein [Verrucomicrobium sp.]
MPIHNYRPIKDVTYTPPGGSALPLTGILSMSVTETSDNLVEATDGYAHANNAVPRARTTQVTLRSRDLAALRAIDRAAQGGVLRYTLIGLGGAADILEQVGQCHSRGVRASATAPQPYTCEVTFDCVTDQDYAVGTQE